MVVNEPAGGAGVGSSAPQSKAVKLSPVGWMLLLLGLYVLSKSRTGYHLIYYALVLILVYLVVSNYQSIDALLGRIQTGGTSP